MSIESAKGFVINQVNPKFKEYNKPFFLALMVGIPTAVLTFMMFMLLVTQCAPTSYTASSPESLLDKGARCKCIQVTRLLKSESPDARFVNCDIGSDATYCEREGFVEGFDKCPSGAQTPLLMLECDECPAPLPTLGAALGYAGFIELAITIACVFTLTQCGILRGGPEGHMGKMIKELMKTKDTGKEIGGEVVGFDA